MVTCMLLLLYHLYEEQRDSLPLSQDIKDPDYIDEEEEEWD